MSIAAYYKNSVEEKLKNNKTIRTGYYETTTEEKYLALVFKEEAEDVLICNPRMRKWDSESSGCRKLARSMITRALLDTGLRLAGIPNPTPKPKAELVKDAMEWIASDDESPASFIWCAQVVMHRGEWVGFIDKLRAMVLREVPCPS